MIPADKLGHLKAGTEAALFGAGVGIVIGLCLHWLDLLPLHFVFVCAAVGAAVSATSAGITKEKADKADNDAMAAEGKPPMHGVEVLDAVATSIPGWILCAVLLLAKEVLA